MHLGEALVPEAHCSTPVLEHGNNHHRNSSSERNCISHSRCFFMPIPAHSITHLKPDGALSISLFLPLCFPSLSRVVQLRPLGNKNWQNISNICLSRQKGQKKKTDTHNGQLQQLAPVLPALWFLVLITCHVWALSAGFIIVSVVHSETQTENIASLTGEWSRVGQQVQQLCHTGVRFTHNDRTMSYSTARSYQLRAHRNWNSPPRIETHHALQW